MMEIVFTDEFKTEFSYIFDFIANDSLNRANDFKNLLLEKLKTVSLSPYAFRKSINFDNENIRDFIFKGYTIPYYVKDDKIYVLGIYKSNIWK